MNKKNRLVSYTLFFSLIFLADRITKHLALSNLFQNPVDIFPGFRLKLIWNTGVSWNLFEVSSRTGFYILLAVIFSIIIAFCAHTVGEYKKGTPIWFECAVLAGALSNALDRVLFGGVIDFIDLYITTWHWPTFNIADACIVIGIVGIVLRAWGEKNNEYKKDLL